MTKPHRNEQGLVLPAVLGLACAVAALTLVLQRRAHDLHVSTNLERSRLGALHAIDSADVWAHAHWTGDQLRGAANAGSQPLVETLELGPWRAMIRPFRDPARGWMLEIAVAGEGRRQRALRSW